MGAVEMKEVKLGDVVTIMCNNSFYNEIHWLKISVEGQPIPLMVTNLKHNGELSVVWNLEPTHFEGIKDSRIIGLRIFNVSTNDLATYYCVTVNGKRMNFDEGLKLYTIQGNEEEQSFNLVQGKSFVGHSPHYQVFAAVLSFGLLGMLVAVSVVHMKARTKNKMKNDHIIK